MSKMTLWRIFFIDYYHFLIEIVEKNSVFNLFTSLLRALCGSSG